MKRKKLGVLSGTILLALILLVMPFMAGCAKPAPAPEVKTLKIGALLPFEFPLGMMAKKELEAIVPVFNEKGGLVINGERYNIDLILYDTKMSPEIGRAAVERLVYEDKVKFILGDETWAGWVPVTEAEKVLVVAASPSPEIFNPDYKYIFQASWLNTQAPAVWGWFTETYPHLNTIAPVFPDSLVGQMEAKCVEHLSKVFGLELLDLIIYPTGTTDFSAIATKLKGLNADIFTSGGGGPVEGPLLHKALYEAGYTGQRMSHLVVSPGAMAKVIPMNIVEGMITAMGGTELEPPPPVAKELMDAYTAKYGTWDYPIIIHLLTWHCLIAGLEQAQSLDPDKVAAVISNGMRFESPHALGIMISRPDMGNPRTVDALYETYIGRIEGGKAKLIHTISAEKGLEYFEVAYGK